MIQTSILAAPFSNNSGKRSNYFLVLNISVIRSVVLILRIVITRRIISTSDSYSSFSYYHNVSAVPVKKKLFPEACWLLGNHRNVLSKTYFQCMCLSSWFSCMSATKLIFLFLRTSVFFVVFELIFFLLQIYQSSLWIKTEQSWSAPQKKKTKEKRSILKTYVWPSLFVTIFHPVYPLLVTPFFPLIYPP